MNLRNGTITVGEIMRNPKAQALLTRTVPQAAGLLNGPLARRVWNMPLNAALGYARRYLSPGQMQWLLTELSSL